MHFQGSWGVLENHWNGALLDTLEAIVGYAKSMTRKKQDPVVRLATKNHQLGVSLSKQAMKDVEHRLDRL
ncbi:MAG: ISAzo13 family transposase, partial [Myxococcales bacterium]|nr:ISAzo13 family transposase [Myxococcales bacterium]